MRNLLLVVCVVLLLGCEPKTYDECILKNITAGMAKEATILIKKSCYNKLTIKTRTEQSLPHDVLKKIDGRAALSDIGYFEGKIFNNNDKWAIKSLVIRITDNETKKYRDYNTNVSLFKLAGGFPVTPLRKGVFSFEAYDFPKDSSWFIESGTGTNNP